jgi:hypothetical protein
LAATYVAVQYLFLALIGPDESAFRAALQSIGVTAVDARSAAHAAANHVRTEHVVSAAVATMIGAAATATWLPSARRDRAPFFTRGHWGVAIAVALPALVVVFFVATEIAYRTT